MSKWAAIAEAAKQKTRPVQKGLKGAVSPSADSEQDFLHLSALSAQGSNSEKQGIGGCSRQVAGMGVVAADVPAQAPAVQPLVRIHDNDWPAWIRGRTGDLLTLLDGRRRRYTVAEARSLAFSEAVTRWHMQHAEPDPHVCAGCEKPIGDEDILSLPDGARVHWGDCLIKYGELWRERAESALRANRHEQSQ